MSELNLTWKPTWFKRLCSQGGVAEVMQDKIDGINAFANSQLSRKGGIKSDCFRCNVDWNNGFPHGRVWAANPYAKRAEAKYKILEKGL